MVNVTDGPDVHVRLVALEFLLRHVPLTSHLADRLVPNGAHWQRTAAMHFKIWSGGRDLNPQPSPWKSETLPLSYPRPALPQTFPRRGLRRAPLNSWSLGPASNPGPPPYQGASLPTD